jgi:hypothetical protein
VYFSLLAKVAGMMHDDAPACGFDLGNMEFSSENAKISSASHSRFFMMIYLSVIGLVDGLLSLKSRREKFEFVDADFSFIVMFKKEKSKVGITLGNVCLGRFDLDDILAAIDSGIDDFLQNGNVLAGKYPVSCDLCGSVHELKRMLSG